jgi:histidinol-phosphate aminotransferase
MTNGVNGSVPSSAKPAHFSLSQIIRPNILQLTPYRCARDDYSEGILLDANENALGPSFAPASDGVDLDLDLDELALNRYPDPNQVEIKKRIADLRGLDGPENVFLGVGSDEVIDLLFRVVCTPGKDSVLGESYKILLSAISKSSFSQMSQSRLRRMACILSVRLSTTWAS